MLEDVHDNPSTLDVTEPATPRVKPSGLRKPTGLATPGSGLRMPSASGLRTPAATGAKVRCLRWDRLHYWFSEDRSD